MELLYYPAIAIGTFFEGEITLILAAVLINQNSIHALPVVLVAWLGSFLGDWFFFHQGQTKGVGFGQRHPRLKPRLDAVSSFLNRFPTVSIFVLRFQIAMRMAGCFLLGSGQMQTRRFLQLNAVACLAWSAAITWVCVLFTRFAVELFARL